MVSLITSRDDDETSFLVIVQDISQEVEAQHELNKMHQKLQVHLDNSPLGVVEYDKDLFITKWSKRCEEIFGWTESELIEKRFDAYSLIHKDDLERVGHVAVELSNGSIEGNMSRNRNYTKNGGVVHCVWYNSVFKDEKGEVQSVMSLVQDVTSQFEMEKQHQRSSEHLQLIYNNTNDMIFLLAVEPNDFFKYVSVNDQFLTTTDTEREKVIGGGAGELLDKEGVTTLRDQCKQVVETGKTLTYQEPVHLMKRDIFVETHLTPIFNESGVCVNILGVSRDITLRKQQEEELEKSYRVTKNQNQRLLNFAYIVSHNLRTHTSNITGILHMLDRTEDGTKKEKLLDYLRTVANTLDDTMHHLNEVVNIQTNQNITRQKISLKEYVDKTIELLREQILEKRAKLTNRVASDAYVNFNPSYLESVLLNFMSNALKYSHQERNPEIELTTEMTQEFVVLQIADNGMGIDLKKHSDSLFGMYQRFHLGTEGKGLGLFITKNQVDSMGGKIEVESEKGRGTTFKVYLPRK